MENKYGQTIMRYTLYSYNALQVILFTCNLLLLAALYWINQNCGYVTIPQLLFQLTVPLGTGLNQSLVTSALLLLSAVLAISILYAWFLYRKQNLRKTLLGTCLLVAVFAYGIYELQQDCNLMDFVETHTQKTDIFDAIPERENVLLARTQKKKNLVLIFMESIENTFNDTSVWGEPLMPQLLKLQQENISFPNVSATEGTSWTTGAITAAFLGVPLIIPIDKNSMGDFSEFMPRSDSIFYHLKQNGYTIYSMYSADFTFGGERNLIKTHCADALLMDKKWIQQTQTNWESKLGSGWGFRDRYVYDLAKIELPKIAQSNQPFFFMLQTIDTHNPPYCDPEADRKYGGKERDAFRAADAMAADFVTWLKQQPFFNDTVVVILGDHPIMKKDLDGIQIKGNRSIYNVFINAQRSPELSNRKVCSPCDFAPTILEALGFSVPRRRFGIGTSLFSNEPTLTEQLGLHKYNVELSKTSERYKHFFSAYQSSVFFASCIDGAGKLLQSFLSLRYFFKQLFL